MTSLLRPAPPWTPPHSREVDLFHGCLRRDARQIQAHGIDPKKGKLNTDFGQGFYTTTIQAQAESWAWTRHLQSPRATPGDDPVMLRFTVARDVMGQLACLVFVRAGLDADDYWSLVQHCRQSGTGANHHDHPDPARGGWYDMVVGPVAAFWEQRSAMVDSDQVSFHTGEAVAVLNQVMQRGQPAFALIDVVP